MGKNWALFSPFFLFLTDFPWILNVLGALKIRDPLLKPTLPLR